MSQFLNRWLMGFVILQMWGKYVERFINLAIRNGLEIWDIKRTSNDQFLIKMRIKHFFRLRPLLKETGTRMRIVKKIGFPFFLKRALSRKGIIAGFIFFFVILYMLSSMIWRVEIYGLEEITRGEVLSAAQEIGIKEWNFKWRLKDLDTLQRELTKRLDKASWIGVRFDGVVAKITVVEKVSPDNKKAMNPRHLVAKKKAVVKNIFAQEGFPKVHVNQLVTPGQILISGLIGPEGDPSRQQAVPARGEVWGEVWYDKLITVPLKREINHLTGKSNTDHYLILGKYGIKMWGYGRKNEPDVAKVEEDRSYIHIGKYRLPIGWKTEEKFEAEKEVHSISKEEAIKIGLEYGRKNLLQRTGVGSQIIQEKVLRQWVENDKLMIKVHYVILEEISKENPIIIHP
jgi:similar to stage IV sporulation protein